MANTRQSLKRIHQSQKKNERNQKAKKSAKTAVKKAILAIQSKDANAAKDAYVKAVSSLSRTASKGVIPKTRAARKISRLTELAKKAFPEALNFKN